MLQRFDARRHHRDRIHGVLRDTLLAFAEGPIRLLTWSNSSAKYRSKWPMRATKDSSSDSKRKTLANAETIDTEGEKASTAGQFERAEDDFLKTKVILHNLGI